MKANGGSTPSFSAITKKVDMLADILRTCLQWCQDDQAGLDKAESLKVTKIADLLDEYEIDDVKGLAMALQNNRSLVEESFY